jgi:hypothetical protein
MSGRYFFLVDGDHAPLPNECEADTHVQVLERLDGVHLEERERVSRLRVDVDSQHVEASFCVSAACSSLAAEEVDQDWFVHWISSIANCMYGFFPGPM